METNIMIMTGLGTIITAVNAALLFINQLMIQNAIKDNNAVLLRLINGTYVKKEVSDLSHRELERRLAHVENLLDES